jgi:hypothetical protein
MSSLPMSASTSTSASTRSRTINWRAYLPVALTAIVAALSNVVVYFLGDAIIDYHPDFVELGSAVGIAIFTGVLALAAALIYAGLLRFTDRAKGTFQVIAAVVLVVSLIPDLTLIPGEPGVSNGQTAVLMVMHVVAAAVIVPVLTAFPRD